MLCATRTAATDRTFAAQARGAVRAHDMSHGARVSARSQWLGSLARACRVRTPDAAKGQPKAQPFCHGGRLKPRVSVGPFSPCSLGRSHACTPDETGDRKIISVTFFKIRGSRPRGEHPVPDDPFRQKTPLLHLPIRQKALSWWLRCRCAAAGSRARLLRHQRRHAADRRYAPRALMLHEVAF